MGNRMANGFVPVELLSVGIRKVLGFKDSFILLCNTLDTGHGNTTVRIQNQKTLARIQKSKNLSMQNGFEFYI